MKTNIDVLLMALVVAAYEPRLTMNNHQPACLSLIVGYHPLLLMATTPNNCLTIIVGNEPLLLTTLIPIIP